MKSKPQPILLDISWKALFKVLAVLVGLWTVVTLRDVWVMLFVVFIFVAAVNPTISRWQSKMSRVLAVSLFYVLMLVILLMISSIFVPTFIHQVNDLNHNVPIITEHLHNYLTGVQSGNSVIDQLSTNIKNALESLSSSLVHTTVAIVGGLVTLITALVISFYLLLEEDNAKEFFHQILPQDRYEAVYHTVHKIADRMGAWVRGQVLVMVIIGLANLIAYFFLGLPSPLPLGIWAGLCEVIPYVGPTLGLLPAVIVALTTGTLLQALLVVLIGYGVIQQLESHFIVPKLMSRAVGLSPVLVIVALTIGVKLFGLTGAVIAVPVAAIISVVVAEWPALRHLWEDEE